MSKRGWAWIGPLFMFCILVASLWLLHRELNDISSSDLFASLTALPATQLGCAVLLTCVSYVILFAYDVLGLWYIRHPMAWHRVALAAFLGHAVGNNFGTLLGGSTIRLRLYTAWGLSALDIFKLMLLLSFTFWIGLFAIAGVLFLVDPLPIPPRLHLPIQTSAPLGYLFVSIALAYLLMCGIRRKPIRYKGWELEPPAIWLSLAQYLVAAVDLCVSASVLYVLMPKGLEIGFVHFLSIYLLGLTIGILSNVPGGLGVTELVIVVLLGPTEPHEVLSALLLFRAIYYLIPLVIGLVILSINEVLPHRERASGLFKRAGHWVRLIAPRYLSITIFLSGLILLISGATPADAGRLHLLRDLLPLPVVEISHLLGSTAGILLLLLARALQRRIETAYYCVIGLLVGGILFSLLKGLDYEEACLLGLMLLLFAPTRKHYYRKGSLLVDRWNPGWFISLGAILLSIMWLVAFSFRHVEYDQQLWWQFAFNADAPRSLRATAVVALLILAFASARLLRARLPAPHPPTLAELQAAEVILGASPKTIANLALLGDKFLMLNEAKTAFIMFGVEGRSWISMGDPIGPDDECRELAWQFRERCDEGGCWPVFYQVDSQRVPLYAEMGLALLKLGEEARVPLANFNLNGGERKGLRKTHRQLSEAGCTFEVVDAHFDDGLMQELKRVSDQWLGEKNTSEKGFSLGRFQADYLRRFPIALIRHHGRLIAFANIWKAADKSELSVDLMRHTNDAPNGTMELLFIHLMLWGKEQGFAWFNLGMAPLSGVEKRRIGPLWNQFARLAFDHGEHFYNFRGLRQYKEKFDPQWHPKYLAAPGGYKIPIVLANVASVISGGLTRLIKK